MTVCIGAIANQSANIVCCVDTLISTGTTSFDPLVAKMSGIKGWTVMCSGTLSYAEMLLRRFTDFMLAAQDNEPRTVESCLERALLIELPRFSAAKLLAPFGWDMPTFLKDGRKQLTNERFNELTRQIEEYSDNYDCELIVAGWGDAAEAHPDADATIISADRDGVIVHSSDEPFYACGSGGTTAYASLAFQNVGKHHFLVDAVYYVAEAKFMSEKTIGVGPNSLMWVSNKYGDLEYNGFFVQPEDMRRMYEAWRKDGAPKMSGASLALIEDMLKKEQRRR